LRTGSEDFKKEIARLDKDFEALQETQTRPCAAGGAISKESVATRLGNELYRRRLGRLKDIDFKYFVDGLEPDLWWYRVIMLLEGVALTATSRFVANDPTILFGLAAAISAFFAALSAYFSPFLEDQADRIDVSTRAGNSMIFMVGFVKSLTSDGGALNTVCEYILFCVSITTFLNVVYNFRPIERITHAIKSKCSRTSRAKTQGIH
jgi:hypothetical protein